LRSCSTTIGYKAVSTQYPEISRYSTINALYPPYVIPNITDLLFVGIDALKMPLLS